MKLAAKYDIEAPVDFVYAQLVDFDGWERAAMLRGADVSRIDRIQAPGPGMTWATQFHYRAKDRKATLRIDALTPQSHLALTAMSVLVDGVMEVDLLNLGARRTRVAVRLEVNPKTLAARIYVQALRLARSRVDRSFSQRIAQFAAEMEERFRSRVPNVAP